jgi:hypothetical protein
MISASERRNFLLTLFLIGLLLLGMAAIADATTLVRLDFEDLASRANAIARLQCVRVESHWQNGEIWTSTEFLVLDQQKGTLPRAIEIEMPGGIIGHLHSRVEEVPSFLPGEQTYLFLWSAPNGSYRILGWSQGAFRIRKDPATGAEFVTQDSANAPIFDPVAHHFRHGGVRRMPIAVFQLKLKRALEHR